MNSNAYINCFRAFMIENYINCQRMKKKFIKLANIYGNKLNSENKYFIDK